MMSPELGELMTNQIPGAASQIWPASVCIRLVRLPSKRAERSKTLCALLPESQQVLDGEKVVGVLLSCFVDTKEKQQCGLQRVARTPSHDTLAGILQFGRGLIPRPFLAVARAGQLRVNAIVMGLEILVRS